MADLTTQELEILEDRFMRIGVKSMSMDEIARVIGISKKTLYDRIPSKELLVEQVLDYTLNKERSSVCDFSTIAANAIHEMQLIMVHVTQLIHRLSASTIYDLKKYYPTKWKMIESGRRQLIFERISNNIKRGKSEDLYREEIDTDLIASLYRYISTSIIDDADKIMSVPRDILFKEFVKYHLHGISTEKGQKLLQEYDL